MPVLKYKDPYTGEVKKVGSPQVESYSKTEADAKLAKHTNDTSNPHNVTYSQVGAAPDGYGLGKINGEFLTTNDNLNDKLTNGVYWWSDAPKNAPLTYCAMRVFSGVDSYSVQEIITGNIYHDNVVMRRYTKTGVSGWQPWEYVNPPMIIGEEYRTTERWNNQPVYTMLKDCGVTATRTSTSAPTGATRIIRYEAWCNNKLLPLADYIGRESYYAYTSVDVDGLVVWYNGDSKSDGFGSGREHWYVQLWYTK